LKYFSAAGEVPGVVSQDFNARASANIVKGMPKHLGGILREAIKKRTRMISARRCGRGIAVLNVAALRDRRLPMNVQLMTGVGAPNKPFRFCSGNLIVQSAI